jgi:hypothetical protein
MLSTNPSITLDVFHMSLPFSLAEGVSTAVTHAGRECVKLDWCGRLPAAVCGGNARVAHHSHVR